MNRTILINAASCTIGGGVQVADGFVRRLISPAWRDRSWILALSQQVRESLGDINIPFPHIVTKGRPGSVFSGHFVRKDLLRFAAENGATSVFTVFGPSFVRFKVPELMGFANGFMLAEGSTHFANHPLGRRLLSFIKKHLRKGYLTHADAYWVETESARRRLAAFLKKDPSFIYVIANSVNPSLPVSLHPNQSRPNTFLYLAAPYWHKNHQILPEAARVMDLDLSLPKGWRFVVTLPEESPVWKDLYRRIQRVGMGHRFVNVGAVPLFRCPKLFADAVALVHPSLLETFSATYLEAMWFGVPIAASSRDFSREICGEAAVYFDPTSPISIAQVLGRLASDTNARDNLISEGRKQLVTFPSPLEKYDRMARLALKFAGHTKVSL